MTRITRYNNIMSIVITILDNVNIYQGICSREVLESNANVTLKTVYSEDKLEFGSR